MKNEKSNQDSGIVVSDGRKPRNSAYANLLRACIVIIAFGFIGATALLLTHAAPMPNTTIETSSSCTPNAVLVNPCRPLYGTAMATQTPYPQVASDPVSQMKYQDQRIGHTSDIAHIFNSLGHNTIPAPGLTLINDGYTLMLNWKPASPWVNGSNGSDNAAIDAMAASLKSVAPHKVMLVIWHEPENDVSPGGADCTVSKGNQGTAAQYVAMWHYTVNRLRADGVSNAVYVEYFQNYPPLNCNNKNQLYAGDSYVDWIGFDDYVSYGSFGTQSWDDVVGTLYNFFTKNSNSTHDYLSKPWMLSEIGIANEGTPDAEAWYNQAAAAVTANTFPNLKAYVDYDDNNPSTGVAENRQAYSDSNVFTQAKQNAYNNFVNAIYDKAKTSTPTPPAPTPPTTDKTAPTVSITAPSNGSTVSGTVTVSTAPSDNVGVTKVNFLVDNTFTKSITSAPWTFSWNTTLLSSGTHTIEVKAFDAAGNVGVSKALTITVKGTGGTPQPTPTPPVKTPSPITAPPVTTISMTTPSSPTPIAVSGKVTVVPPNAQTKVTLSVDGKAVQGDTVNTTQLANGVHTLTITENGKTKTQKISVNNPLQTNVRNYLLANRVAYAGTGTVLIIAIVIFIWFYRPTLFKRFMPGSKNDYQPPSDPLVHL